MKHFKLFGLHIYLSKQELTPTNLETHERLLKHIPDEGITYGNLIRLMTRTLALSTSAAKHRVPTLCKRKLIFKSETNGRYYRVND